MSYLLYLYVRAIIVFFVNDSQKMKSRRREENNVAIDPDIVAVHASWYI